MNFHWLSKLQRIVVKILIEMNGPAMLHFQLEFIQNWHNELDVAEQLKKFCGTLNTEILVESGLDDPCVKREENAFKTGNP